MNTKRDLYFGYFLKCFAPEAKSLAQECLFWQDFGENQGFCQTEISNIEERVKFFRDRHVASLGGEHYLDSEGWPPEWRIWLEKYYYDRGVGEGIRQRLRHFYFKNPQLKFSEEVIPEDQLATFEFEILPPELQAQCPIIRSQ